MMRWEKKRPDCEGLWASSLDGKTLKTIHIFRLDVAYDPNYYWCRIGDVPEISPKMKKLSFEDLVECIKDRKGIMISKKNDTFLFKETIKISSLRIFEDGTYVVYVDNNSSSFDNTDYRFYGDL